MADRVRLGLIGTSWWVDGIYLPALQTHPQAELVAICGRGREAAEQLAAKYAIPQVYTSYGEMLARAGLDAVIIATPDDLHYAMAMDALSAGLHVLCEKPLARTAAEAQALYRAAEERGLLHMVFFTYRWLPSFRHLKALIDQGYIGRVYHADFRFNLGFGHSGNYTWRYDRQRANGVVGDLGSHLIDLARWYLGDVAGVSARLATFVTRPGADGQAIDPANDVAMLLLDFADGAMASIQVSGISQVVTEPMQLQVVISGEHGTLTANLWSGDVRGVRRGAAEPELLPAPDALWGEADRGDPFNVLFTMPVGAREFVEAVAARRPGLSPSFADGYQAQAVVDAALLSHASGQRVAVEAPIPAG